MKAKIYDEKGKEKGTVELPKNFTQRIREDILSKVFEAQRQVYSSSYGSKIGAGGQYSASGISKKKRHDWKGTYGKGISRIPRKIMSRHGASFNWVGATAPNTRGGRRAHAPKSEKNPFNKINKKELTIAFNSALAGTIDSKYLEKKFSQKVNSGFVFNEEILKLKTKEFLAVLRILFADSYSKLLKVKSVRAGKGKMRGRKYKSNAGLLFVIGSEEKMKRSGMDVINVNELKISDLSPNGEPGRLTCYTEKAIKEIEIKFK